VPDYFFHVSAALFIGIAFSFVLERLIKPQPVSFWQRPIGAVWVHIALWLLIYAVEFLQFGRPWIAMVLANTIYAVLIAVNNVKYRTLREPFLYQDFEYFIDAFKYPRLYVPFFGWLRAISCIVAVVLGLLLFVPLETPVSLAWGGLEYRVVLLTLIALSVILLMVWGRGVVKISFHSSEDLQKFGFLPTLWYYLLAEKKTIESLHDQSTLCLKPTAGSTVPSRLPHVIAVQSESFFDVRRWLPQVKKDVLQQFDRLCAESVRYGTLEVCAWGANTVRTEFAFLTGLDVNRLGVHKFNPYRRLVSTDTPSVVNHYKNLGYHTIAIHPYSKKFYRRERVFPLLGFDRFLDIEQFDSAQRTGPFVSDAEVSDLIEQILRDNRKAAGPPLFIFVITMENHGPLHLEVPRVQSIKDDCTQPLPAGCEDVGIYLKHLRNADAMIGRLSQALKACAEQNPNSNSYSNSNSDSYSNSYSNLSPLNSSVSSPLTERPGLLVWYGDHVPIMDKAFNALGTPSGCTDYFLWSTDHQSSFTQPAIKQAMPVHELARAVIDISSRAG